MNYKLLNFDHGNAHSEFFDIGPFQIKINEQHCQNLLHLPKNPSITFGYDQDYKKAIIKNSKIEGSWIETAEVEIDDSESQPSVIYPATSSKNSIDDLCLLLSFVTGRIVSFEGNQSLDHYNPDRHVDKAINYGYFLRESFHWQQLRSINNEGLSVPFYYLMMSYQANDLVAKAVYCNNALNAAYDKWYRKNPITFINKDIQSKIKFSINQCLEEESINEIIKEDILNRVSNIFQPSAICKLKHFLRGINLYPKYDNPEMHKRLKWINNVRNSMAHTGKLPEDNKLSDSLLSEIVVSITNLILRINQYYFGYKILELNDPYLKYINKLITSYFYEGKFSDRLIFSETHEAYMERAKKEWLTE